jgi:hypothetical protein
VQRSEKRPRALFVDPYTGVREKRDPKHVSFSQLAEHASDYELVFAFDQAFSRGAASRQMEQMTEKRRVLIGHGCAVMYYSSHAHFVFVSRRLQILERLRKKIIGCGIPPQRLNIGERP